MEFNTTTISMFHSTHSGLQLSKENGIHMTAEKHSLFIGSSNWVCWGSQRVMAPEGDPFVTRYTPNRHLTVMYIRPKSQKRTCRFEQDKVWDIQAPRKWCYLWDWSLLIVDPQFPSCIKYIAFLLDSVHGEGVYQRRSTKLAPWCLQLRVQSICVIPKPEEIMHHSLSSWPCDKLR